ncbi:N-acetyl-gamma-glutamyl-phosphate reductase [Vibrio cholerae]|nr:N-acetyl-gamma-glutamyl-phosphate reductase [Vibrio cholerae]
MWLTAPLSFPNIRTFIERLGASVALRTPFPAGFLVRIFQYATQGAYVLHSRED